MIGTFWISLIKSDPNWTDIAKGIYTPSQSAEVSDALLGLVGAIIMPHNF